MDHHDENKATGSGHKESGSYSKYKDIKHGKDKERRVRDSSEDDSAKSKSVHSELMRKNSKPSSGSYRGSTSSRKHERSKSRSPAKDYKQLKRIREKKTRESSGSSSSGSESSPARKFRSEPLKRNPREKDSKYGKDVSKSWRKDDDSKYALPEKSMPSKYALPEKRARRGRSKDRRMRDSSRSSSSSSSSDKTSPVAQSRFAHSKQPIADVRLNKDEIHLAKSKTREGPRPSDRNIKKEGRGRKRDHESRSSSSSSETSEDVSRDRKSKQKVDVKKHGRTKKYEKIMEELKELSSKQRGKFIEKGQRVKEGKSKSDSSSSSYSSEDEATVSHNKKSESINNRKELEKGDEKKSDNRHLSNYEEKSQPKYEVAAKRQEQSSKDKKRSESDSSSSSSESSEPSDRKTKDALSKEERRKISVSEKASKNSDKHIKGSKTSQSMDSRRKHKLGKERNSSESSSDSENSEASSAPDRKADEVISKQERKKISEISANERAVKSSNKHIVKAEVSKSKDDLKKQNLSKKRSSSESSSGSDYDEKSDEENQGKETHVKNADAPTYIKSSEKLESKMKVNNTEQDFEKGQTIVTKDISPVKISSCERHYVEGSSNVESLVVKIDEQAELELMSEDKSVVVPEVPKEKEDSLDDSIDRSRKSRSASKNFDHKTKTEDYKKTSKVLKTEEVIKENASSGETTKAAPLTSREHQSRRMDKKYAASGSDSSRSSSSRSASNSSSSSSDSSSSDSSSSKSSSKSSVSGGRSSSSSSTSSSTSSEHSKHAMKSKTRARKRSRSLPGSKKRRRRSATPLPKKIHIGRLSKNINKTHLEEIFGMYGHIKNIDMPIDRLHGNASRRFAYVEYETHDDAKKATKHMNGGLLDGYVISVAPVMMYKPKPVPIVRRVAPPRQRFPHWRFTPPFRGGGRGFGGDRRRQVRSSFHRRSPVRRPRSRSPIHRRRRHGSVSSR